MKSFGKFISKNFASFIGLILIIAVVNIAIYGIIFRNVIYNETKKPEKTLESITEVITKDGLPNDMISELTGRQLWVFMMGNDGKIIWSVNLPSNVPDSYSIGDVAVFSKGYIEDYPVFVQTTDIGLLVLGYPKDSFVKLPSNYYALTTIQKMHIFIILILIADLFLLFLAHYFSKRKIMDNISPILSSIQDLSKGENVKLSDSGELSEIACEINIVSEKIDRQNKARANWISGISHDIRTPLPMIMGYADRIENDLTVNSEVSEQANVICTQSIKIKELIQDLNLVSQLEYDMQPLKKSKVRISKLLRTYVANLINADIDKNHIIELNISKSSEQIELECDERLIVRALSNLVQNSVNHNPEGCIITVSLSYNNHPLCISVSDNGVGVTSEKLREINLSCQNSESIDGDFEIKHGLGINLVRKIVEAHNGTLLINSVQNKGLTASIFFYMSKNSLI